MSWFEHARILCDWVRFGEDLSPEYADWIVEKTLRVNADILSFCAQVGGFALWESAVTPMYHHLNGMDLIGELVLRCRENGLRFVPWWMGTAMGGVARVLQEHPSWQQMGPPSNGGEEIRYPYICFNSPYRELIYEELREVLERYEIDGIYLDQLPISCYCSWCQAKFEKQYNQPMPIVSDEFLIYTSSSGFPPLLREFRDESVKSFCSGIRKMINEVRPEACYVQNWVPNQQSRLVRGLVDAVLPEFYQKEDLIPLGLRHRLTKAYFDQGAIWGNVRHSVFADARHHPVRGTQMLLVDCVANHATPILLDLCSLDFDPTGVEELGVTLNHLRDIQAFQEEAYPVRYAAILHSLDTQELYGARFDEAFEGLYRLCFEFHIPFEIINEEGIQNGDLDGFKVLILPDTVALSNKTVAAIRKRVDEGMGLIATYMTGMFNEVGQRRVEPALADLFGIEIEDVTAYDTPEGIFIDPLLRLADIDKPIFHYGSANSEHPLAYEISPDAYFSYQGGYVVCRIKDGVEVFAELHSLDQTRLSGRPYNRRLHYPGSARFPLGAAHQLDRARVVYIAIQAESEKRRAHAPELDELFHKSILWTGGPPPIETPDCPRSVEVRLFFNGNIGAHQIILVNLTTNRLVELERWDPSVIRYVTPQKGIELVLPLASEVESVKSQIGNEITSDVQEDKLFIRIPFLDLYDSIIVNYR
ncbi:MAG: hypothetical protein GTO18_10170 [Anaerolineales bacterium]|nr:hypothetical protein [Anaerolineales bacterium]